MTFRYGQELLKNGRRSNDDLHDDYMSPGLVKSSSMHNLLSGLISGVLEKL